jgi:hypothetical protein
MSMALFAVTITATTAKGDPVWFPFWVPDIEALPEFHETLRREGTLLGTRYKTKREGDFHRILSLKPYILGKNFVAQVVEMNPDSLIDFQPPKE